VLRSVRSGLAQPVLTTRAEYAMSCGWPLSGEFVLCALLGPLLAVGRGCHTCRPRAAGGPARGVSEPALANPKRTGTSGRGWHVATYRSFV